MKCLSVRQPWAWAIIHGGKDVENRTWATKYRGPLGIHAGMQFDFNPKKHMDAARGWHDAGFKWNEADRGMIIGVVTVVDCIPASECKSDWAFKDSDQDIWCWVLENPKPIPLIKVKGQLGIFDVHDSLFPDFAFAKSLDSPQEHGDSGLVSTNSESLATFLPLAQLECWPRNYRIGLVEEIAKSIARFGFNTTLRVWRGQVMAGNHAMKALQQLHAEGKPIPRGIIEDPGGGWLAPCLIIDHLSETEAEAFAVVDNALSDRSQNDDQALLEVLADLARLDESAFEATGFTLDDLNQMAGYTEPTEPSFQEAPPSFRPVDEQETEHRCPKCGYEWSGEPK